MADLEPLFAYTTFTRLKWQLFSPVSAVRVLDFDEENKPVWNPLLGDQNMQSHGIAHAPATDPPCSRIEVVLDTVDSWDHWWDTEIEDQRPRPLVLDGAPSEEGCVTVGQFVTLVHEYVEGLRDLLFEMRGTDEEEVQFYFATCIGPSKKAARESDEIPLFGVCLVDSQLRDLDEWWNMIIARVRDSQTV